MKKIFNGFLTVVFYFPKKMIGLIVKAILRPGDTFERVGLFRTFLLKRRIFDLTSYVIQLIDYRKQQNYQRKEWDNETVRLTIEHNLGEIQEKRFTVTRRTEPFYQVATIDRVEFNERVKVKRNIKEEKILVIGGRNRVELLVAWLYGFSWKNIFAIDLFSINKKIIEMEMENMTFSDEEFDVVMMINTLGYSSDAFKALSEISRVLKPGGRLVFNHTYEPLNDRFKNKSEKIKGNDLFKHLKKIGLRLYFYDPSDKLNSTGQMQTSHNIGVFKVDKSNTDFDIISVF